MPCDSYGLTVSLKDKLLRALEQAGADIAYATQSGDDHPLVAIWRTSIKDKLQAFMDDGGRSVFRWYATQKVATVDIPVVRGQCFNMNTLEDYQDLLKELE